MGGGKPTLEKFKLPNGQTESQNILFVTALAIKPHLKVILGCLYCYIRSRFCFLVVCGVVEVKGRTMCGTKKPLKLFSKPATVRGWWPTLAGHLPFCLPTLPLHSLFREYIKSRFGYIIGKTI